jgi:1,4-alpha-glucan branching enzyme
MHDTLDYMGRERCAEFHHTALTFRGLYASSELVLPVAREVVHRKDR